MGSSLSYLPLLFSPEMHFLDNKKGFWNLTEKRDEFFWGKNLPSRWKFIPKAWKKGHAKDANDYQDDMGVSKNNGIPKSSILIGFSIIFTTHFGGKTPYFWKHPHVFYIHCEGLGWDPTLNLRCDTIASHQKPQPVSSNLRKSAGGFARGSEIKGSELTFWGVEGFRPFFGGGNGIVQKSSNVSQMLCLFGFGECKRHEKFHKDPHLNILQFTKMKCLMDSNDSSNQHLRGFSMVHLRIHPNGSENLP